MASKGNETPAAIPQWIQPDLFEPIFRKMHPDYRQTKMFEAKPALGAGENYATIMLKITAEVELKDGSSVPISLMMKTAIVNDLFEELRQSHDVFQVEAEMYNKVVPEMEEMYKNAGIKVKFGAESYSLGTDQPYILLEDLTRRGFKNMDRREGLDMEHTKAVLEKLAQWHAASAVRVAIKGPYKPTINDGIFNENVRPMFQEIFDSMTKIYMQCVQESVSPECYESMLASQARVMDAQFNPQIEQDEFLVLIHGDCWSNNVMFRHDEEGRLMETFLVDYQIPSYTTPARDLYYFLLSSTTYDVKLKEFDYFIQYYHQQLEKYLKLLKYPKKIPSLKDLHILLIKHGIWGYNAAAGIMSVVLVDPSEGANIENMIGDTEAGVEFKMQMYKNPRYQKHLKMVMPWLYNRGAIHT